MSMKDYEKDAEELHKLERLLLRKNKELTETYKKILAENLILKEQLSQQKHLLKAYINKYGESFILCLCDECKGSGGFEVQTGEHDWDFVPCDRCAGSGIIYQYLEERV